MTNHWWFYRNQPLNSRGLRFTAKWAALAVVVWFIASAIRGEDFTGALSRLSVGAIAYTLALLAAARLVFTARWWLICRSWQSMQSMDYLFLLRNNLLGEFIGVATPSILGSDGIRALKIKARGYPLAHAASSIALDRATGLIGNAIVALPFIPLLGFGVLAGRGWPMSQFVVALVAVLAAAFAFAAFGLRKRHRVRDTIVMLQARLGSVLLWTALSLPACLLVSSAYYVSWRSLVEIGLIEAFGVVLLSQLMRTIPVSILGVGFVELSFLGMAGYLGSNMDVATAMVVVMMASRYVFSLVGLVSELTVDGISALKGDISPVHDVAKAASKCEI